MARAAVRAYEVVREGILSGDHPAGTWLREDGLAAALGMSRTPVREALRRLHSEGLVELHPNRGALVATWGDAELDDIFELRWLLEGYAARRAAERGELGGKLADLRSLCASMEERLREPGERAYDEITALNLEFHRTVHAAARNVRLPALLSGIIQMPLVRHTFHRYSERELARSFAHHRELVDAIAARDGDWAESVMHAHVRAARASLRRAAEEAAETEEAVPRGDGRKDASLAAGRGEGR